MKNDYKMIRFVEDDLSLDVSADTVGLHVHNICREGELEISTYEESSVVRFERARQVKCIVRIYDLNDIIAVGYRVKPRREAFA